MINKYYCSGKPLLLSAILINHHPALSGMVENITSVAINTAGSLLNQAALVIVILIAGLAIGMLAKKVSLRLLQEIEFNKFLSSLGIAYNGDCILSSLLSYLIYLVTIIIFLDQLGIKSLAIYVVVAGIIGLVMLTFIVGLKDIIPNFWGWMQIRRSRTVKEKRYVKLPAVSGRIQHIGYLETEIKTKKGDVLYVPNSLFIKSKP